MSPDHVITSCSVEGFARYGRRMVDSVRQHWPSAALTIYADAPLATDAVQRTTRDLDLPQVWPDPPTHAAKPRNYIWSSRFAVKVFVWADAAARLGSGLLTWLDADTALRAPVPASFTASVLGRHAVAYLGRGAMHPETGYVAFRLPEAWPLLAWCRSAYTSGAFQSRTDGWTDSHILRAGLAATGVPARDLTSDAIAAPWTSRVDAFAQAPIAPYVVHYKGGASKRGAAACEI